MSHKNVIVSAVNSFFFSFKQNFFSESKPCLVVDPISVKAGWEYCICYPERSCISKGVCSFYCK